MPVLMDLGGAGRSSRQPRKPTSRDIDASLGLLTGAKAGITAGGGGGGVGGGAAQGALVGAQAGLPGGMIVGNRAGVRTGQVPPPVDGGTGAGGN